MTEQKIEHLPSCWAILHKPSGKFLPQKKRGRGFTNDEPDNRYPPRLFTDLKNAKQALGWWLKGVTLAHRSRDYRGEYDETLEIIPKPNRKAEEMEIVSVYIRVGAVAEDDDD